MGSNHSDRFDDTQTENRDHSASCSGDSRSESFESEGSEGDRYPKADAVGKVFGLVHEVYREGLALVTDGVPRDNPEYRALDLDTLQKLRACRKDLDANGPYCQDPISIQLNGPNGGPPLLVTLAWLDLCSSAEYLLDWHKAYDRGLIDEHAKFEDHTAWDWAVLNNSVCMKRLLRQDLDLPSER